MANLELLQKLFNASQGVTKQEDDILIVDIPFLQYFFDLAHECSELELCSSVFEVIHGDQTHNREFSLWRLLPEKIKALPVSKISIEINLKELRQRGLHVYYDEKDLVRLCPLAPEKFLIISLSLNGNKCSLCPSDYNKNEIYRYIQIKNIWQLLAKCADDERNGELVYLYKQKIVLKLNYTIDDLSYDFDGLARLESIFSENTHIQARKDIMQNTLYSFLWREEKSNCFKKIVSSFTLFVQAFEANFRAFSVGFSFDKVRKEYAEKFRDYLGKINGIMYDSLTKALAIPITGLISFVAMKSDNIDSAIINLASLVLVLFSSLGVFFLIKSQANMIVITASEYQDLFDSIRSELDGVDLIDLNLKELQLDKQARCSYVVLNLIGGVAWSNVIINAILFIIKTF